MYVAERTRVRSPRSAVAQGRTVSRAAEQETAAQDEDIPMVDHTPEVTPHAKVTGDTHWTAFKANLCSTGSEMARDFWKHIFQNPTPSGGNWNSSNSSRPWVSLFQNTLFHLV